jgi:hypothetical protein
MNEGPDRPVVHFEAAASKLRHKGAQGEVSLRDSLPKKDGMLTPQERAADSRPSSPQQGFPSP